MLLKKPILSTLEGAEIASLLVMENLPIYMVAVILNVTRLDLARMRAAQQGPPFMQLKRGVIVYPREAFGRYLKSVHRAEIEAMTGARSKAEAIRGGRTSVNPNR